MGGSGFGLLRLLSPKYPKVEDISPHVRGTSSIILVRGLTRHRISLWNLNELGMV